MSRINLSSSPVECYNRIRSQFHVYPYDLSSSSIITLAPGSSSVPYPMLLIELGKFEELDMRVAHAELI